jgi:hypothetical protein
MGQVHVESVHAGRLPELVAALSQAGFGITRAESKSAEAEQYRCRRGSREVILQVSRREGSDELFVVLAHPPYTLWPWRWSGDGRFCGDITEVLDRFHYLD